MNLIALLRFAKTWIIPPGWVAIFRIVHNHVVNNEKPLDSRRYWMGEKLPSPEVNVGNFKSTGLISYSITLNNETRDAVTILPGLSLIIPVNNLDSGYWRFGLSSIQKTLGGVEFSSQSKKICFVSGILEGEWSDVRLDAELVDQSISVSNNSSEAIYLTHPVQEENAKPGEIRNIIVIVLDSITHNLLGAYQKSRELSLTPNIDRFFSSSIVYEKCFSVSEWTMPSLYSIFSGQYPITHGYTDLRNSAPFDWSEKRGYLAELLRNSGYSTLACSTAKVFTPAFGVHAGFNRFFYDAYPDSGRTSRLITGRAIDHLEANSNGKNFLFLHFIDTHEPWAFPSYSENCKSATSRTIDPFLEYSELQAGWGDTKAEPLYTNESKKILSKRSEIRIREVDLHLQSLFDYLLTSGQDKDTVTILTSDHGYAYPGGGQPLLVDSRVHVPLLIKHPEIQGQTVSLPVNQGIDLGPTIAAIGGVTLRTSVGKPIFPFSQNNNRNIIISESVFLDKYKVAVRSSEYTVHIHYKFDIKEKLIRLGFVLQATVFNVLTDDEVPSLSNEYFIQIQKAKRIINEHVAKNSHVFSYSLE